MQRCFHWLRKQARWLQRSGSGLLGMGILTVLIGGYAFHWSWTGFITKTFWDWMQLLIVPAALAVAGFLFARAEHRREKAAEQQKAATERQATEQKTQWERHFAEQQAAAERFAAQWRLETEMKQKEEYRREALLQAYFDRMEVLLIEKGLRHSEPAAEVRHIARARTLTTLQRLDLERQTEVFWFLYESRLLGDQNTERIVDVSDADWSYIQLNVAHLEQIDLSDVDLSHASMQETDLQGATVCHANLQGADLKGAKVYGANLKETNLKDANLRGTKLNDADLTGANLTSADLTNANLQRTDLSQACLTQAILCNSTLRDAVLQRANLSQANLQGAYYTEEQLATAHGRWSIVR
jgi:uncharacterized protein YjbI with pentapeptide repeats